MSKLTVEEAKQFFVSPDFQLADVDPEATPGVSDVDDAFNDYDDDLDELQEMLFANGRAGNELSLIHISEPTRPVCSSRMPSSA